MSAPTKPVVAVFVGNEGVEAAGSTTVQALHAVAGNTIHIRVVVRKPNQALPEWTKWGCEVLVHDVRRPGIEKIFQDDCNAAFWATPTTQDRVQLTEKFLVGCIDNGIDFPVVLSATGAGSREAVHLQAAGDVEALCQRLAGKKVKEQFWDKGKQVLQPIVLRTALYYESLYAFLPTLKLGQLYLPISPDGRAPFVSLTDVGEVAAEILMRPDKWANKTLDLSCGTFSGGDLARSLTMHARDGGVKFETIDAAVAEAVYLQGGLSPWISKANAQLVAFYSGSSHGDTSDVQSVLGRKPTPFAKFAKGLKPHIQSDRPVQVPSFVTSFASGGGSGTNAKPVAADAVGGADSGEESRSAASAAVSAAAALAARDSSLMVTLTATVADGSSLKEVLESWVSEAETQSKVQMLECFASPGNAQIQVLARHGGAEQFSEHIKAVGEQMGPLVKLLEGPPAMRVCGLVTSHLADVIGQIPGRSGFQKFKKFAGFTNYTFTESGVPQGRRHGIMISGVATVREGKLDELKELVVSTLIPPLEGHGMAPPLAYEWYVSGDGSQVAWFEKHANTDDAVGIARKAAATMQRIADDCVEMPAEIAVTGSASPDLLAVLGPLRPVVYDKLAGFTRYGL